MASQSTTARTKVDQPHKVYGAPEQVVADASLSDDEKTRALEELEQDARQLATAAAEGMDGGEPTHLREVLMAKDEVRAGSGDAAFEEASRLLQERLRSTRDPEAHRLIGEAIDSIHRAREAIAAMERAAPPPAGAPRPGSDAELEEEIAKEKLDP